MGNAFKWILTGLVVIILIGGLAWMVSLKVNSSQNSGAANASINKNLGSNLKTCSEQHGKICSVLESCPQVLQAKDSQRCCAVNCTNVTSASNTNTKTREFICKKKLPIKIAWTSIQDCGTGNSWYKETQDKIYYKFTNPCKDSYDSALNIYDKITGTLTLYSVWLQTPEPCYVSNNPMSSFTIGHSIFGVTLFGSNGEKYSPKDPQPNLPDFLSDYPNWYASQWGYGWYDILQGVNKTTINGIPCTYISPGFWCVNQENCIEIRHFNIKSISTDFDDSVFNPPSDCKEI